MPLKKLLEVDLMFRYEFIQNAFWAILIVTPMFGFLGTIIVNNKMAFFSDSLGHSALTGIAIGTILGITNPTIAMILFALLFALLLNKIKDSRNSSRDTIISVFSSTAIALGLVVLSRNGGFAKYSNYLIGDILSIVPNEIYLLIGIFAAVIVFWLIYFNQLLAISINTTLAKSKGVNVKFIENLFIMLIAVIIMVSIRWIGVLIINSLLILPAAASRNIAKNIREYHLYSIVISLFSGVSGLVISYYQKIATGPTIALVAAGIFFVTYVFRRK
jgi:zinc transport system permease protein